MTDTIGQEHYDRIQAGWSVLIQGTVVKVLPADLVLTRDLVVRLRGEDVTVGIESVVDADPPPLIPEPGDWVVWHGMEDPARVLAVIDGRAWLVYANDRHFVRTLSELIGLKKTKFPG